ncbi:hypothetical protein BHE90_002049 [Fusarium euwallaceae]|uniref:Uncharacterized protein n=1 Tax=Fusarium euwallaceae TaxID=1147111 RepID=A0A430M5X3_9HYPO|nr:hypothetical protein BHE90_002049 [Fusarium euwallaceae]
MSTTETADVLQLETVPTEGLSPTTGPLPPNAIQTFSYKGKLYKTTLSTAVATATYWVPGQITTTDTATAATTAATKPLATETGNPAATETGNETSDPPDGQDISGASTVIPGGDKATSTSTSTSAPAQDVKYRGLSDGAVAGVAIACIVAGIALGALAVFLLFRRRRRQPQTNFNQVSNGGIEPKSDVMVAVTPSKSDVDLNQFLLDAIPDKQIEGELHALSELLYQHAESHYHRSPVHLDAQTLAQSLVHIGYSPAASGLDAMTVVALCLEPSSRPVGLRHVLSHVIFSSLDFSSGSNMAMLPPVVRDFLSTIPSAESNNGTAPATSLALSKWRSLSTLLLHPTPADRTPLPVPVAEASQQAGSLANELNTFLRFFAPQDAAGSQAQTSHLQDVILECTKLGYILLSQPSDWRFVFSDKQSRRVVVCPGLEKLSHSDGTRYRSPREVVAVVTMPV